MKIHARDLSIYTKIGGILIILTAMILIGFDVWKISMNDVIAGVLAMQAMVLPIDVSKIKAAHSPQGVKHEKV